MSVLSANAVVDLLRYNGLNSRVEHDIHSGYIWTHGCQESYYLNPVVFKSLIKRGLIVEIGTRGSGFIIIYDLTERQK